MAKRRSWLTAVSLVCFCVLAWVQISIWTWRYDNERFVICHLSRDEAKPFDVTILDRWGIYEGHVGWFRLRSRYDGDLTWLTTFKPVHYGISGHSEGLWGFGYFHTKHVEWGLTGFLKRNDDFQAATVPLWFVLVLTLVFPVRWVWLTVRQRKDIPERACKVCRYDLRAHSAGQRCPECGTVISSPR